MIIVIFIAAFLAPSLNCRRNVCNPFLWGFVWRHKYRTIEWETKEKREFSGKTDKYVYFIFIHICELFTDTIVVCNAAVDERRRAT